jgi:hypothetical protein
MHERVTPECVGFLGFKKTYDNGYFNQTFAGVIYLFLINDYIPIAK